jgi:ACR3 family arsenite efflux pump ArsB
MFVLSFCGKYLWFELTKSTAIAFTATETISNYRAVAEGMLGINSGQAFAGVIGLLVEFRH